MVINSSNNPASVKAGGKGGVTKFIWILAFIILLVGFVWALTNYFKVKSKLEKMSTPTGQQELIKQESQDIIDKVKKLIVLPENEEPTIASITDSAKLSKEQPFYLNAQDGDKVLIYVQSKKAIVYSPSRDILVNVGPVYIDNTEQASTTTAGGQPVVPPLVKTLNVELRNGSSVVGAATTLAANLRKDAQFNVTQINSAANTAYTGDIIVDLSKGDKADLLSALKTKFPGAKIVKALPTGEKATTADVLVIVGN